MCNGFGLTTVHYKAEIALDLRGIPVDRLIMSPPLLPNVHMIPGLPLYHPLQLGSPLHNFLNGILELRTVNVSHELLSKNGAPFLCNLEPRHFDKVLSQQRRKRNDCGRRDNRDPVHLGKPAEAPLLARCNQDGKISLSNVLCRMRLSMCCPWIEGVLLHS